MCTIYMFKDFNSLRTFIVLWYYSRAFLSATCIFFLGNQQCFTRLKQVKLAFFSAVKTRPLSAAFHTLIEQMQRCAEQSTVQNALYSTKKTKKFEGNWIDIGYKSIE